MLLITIIVVPNARITGEQASGALGKGLLGAVGLASVAYCTRGPGIPINGTVERVLRRGWPAPKDLKLLGEVNQSMHYRVRELGPRVHGDA